MIAAFVITHLLTHIFAVFGLEPAELARRMAAVVWHFKPLNLLLYAAFISHFCLTLLVLYRRRTLRLPPWEIAQMLLGLLVIPLIAAHATATRGMYELFAVEPSYTRTVLGIFSSDYYIWRHVALTVVVWGHLVAGIHFWLRFRPSYPKIQPLLYALAVLVPAGALLGMFRAGQEITILAADRAFRAEILSGYGDIRAAVRFINNAEQIAIWGTVAVVALILLARLIRQLIDRRKNTVTLFLTDGRTLPTRSGRTVLETLRRARIPHASVCGGRGRCTTCRIRVGNGADELEAPSALEREALDRIGAPPNVRLACQARPKADLNLSALMPASTTARDAQAPGGVSGHERVVTTMFLDLRGSTTLGERKLPYDVLFILNQFFAEMAEALLQSRGHYAQFAGDGLMALYGLKGSAKDGAIDALRGAVMMLERLESLNERLAAELDAPLRVGIGIHTGEAIVGTMGPPLSPNHSAIGDNINIAARLEAKTKDLGCAAIVSVATLDTAGVGSGGLSVQTVAVRGREAGMEVCAIDSAQVLIALLQASGHASGDASAGLVVPASATA